MASMWQDDLSIEAFVAREMGDEDWMDINPVYDTNTGCSRKATYEVEHPARYEPEPVTVKYDRRFDKEAL